MFVLYMDVRVTCSILLASSDRVIASLIYCRVMTHSRADYELLCKDKRFQICLSTFEPRSILYIDIKLQEQVLVPDVVDARLFSR